MVKDKTTKERLAVVEVQLNNLDEKIDGIVESGKEQGKSIKRLIELQRKQNGMLEKSLGKVTKHLKDHEEDSNFWTLQQYIASNPFRAVMVSITGALIVFTLLIFSNETIVKDLLEFLKVIL